MSLALPVKLNDNYTCQGRDVNGKQVVFDDLLSEGDRVATHRDGRGNTYGRALVVRRGDGLWIEEWPKVVDSEASTAAQRRLGGHGMLIFDAFDSLDLGFDHVDAVDYLRGSGEFRQLADHSGGQLLGVVLGFAAVAVEADRIQRSSTDHTEPGGQ